MAREFNGTDHSLVSAATLNLTAFNKISVSYWLWTNTFANNDALTMESSSDVTANAGAFQINGNSGSGVFQAALNGNVGLQTGGITRPTGAAWHQYVLNFDFTASGSDEVATIWIDGISQSISHGGSDNSGNFGNFTLNVMCRNNASLFLAGRMAELAIYAGTLLTQTNVDALQTTKPHLVGSAAFGWHLDGTASPEPAFAGSVALTVNGATFVDHPPALGAAAAVGLMGGISL